MTMSKKKPKIDLFDYPIDKKLSLVISNAPEISVNGNANPSQIWLNYKNKNIVKSLRTLIKVLKLAEKEIIKIKNKRRQ